jgi:hypothetical protein
MLCRTVTPLLFTLSKTCFYSFTKINPFLFPINRQASRPASGISLKLSGSRPASSLSLRPPPSRPASSLRPLTSGGIRSRPASSRPATSNRSNYINSCYDISLKAFVVIVLLFNQHVSLLCNLCLKFQRISGSEYGCKSAGKKKQFFLKCIVFS